MLMYLYWITWIVFYGKCAWLTFAWVHRRWGDQAMPFQRWKERKQTIFSIMELMAFRRRVARVGLAAGTAVLWLYLSLSLLVHQRLSRDVWVLWDRFSFLSWSIFVFVCWPLLRPLVWGSRLRWMHPRKRSISMASGSVQVIIEPSIKIANLRVLFYLYLHTWHSVL